MEGHLLDLARPDHPYLFGFLQGDGTLAKQKARPNDGRGSLSVELEKGDVELLKRFQRLLTCNSYLAPRTRTTNFKEDWESVVWRLYHQPLRLQLEELGIPVGRKSAIVKPPVVVHVENDYWRGLLDADGSLGLTGSGWPFVSFVTSSDYVALGYLNYLQQVIGKRKTSSRNERDSVYNIAVVKEDAQTVAQTLYYDGALALDRKVSEARTVLGWVRPPNLPMHSPLIRWLPEEDETLLVLGPKEAVEVLSRTIHATTLRHRALKRGGVKRPRRLIYAGMSAETLDHWNAPDNL